MKRAEYAIAMDPLLKSITECGDIGKIIEHERECFLALADVLGHGAEARKLALIIEEYLERNYQKDLLQILNELHTRLTGTRGAVIALCKVNLDTGQLQHVAAGNITVRIFGYHSTRIVSRDGIVGYGTITPVIQQYTLTPGDTLLLHSDGIKEHFDELECLGLLKEDADIISGELLRRFGKKNDDASCIVFKYLE